MNPLKISRNVTKNPAGRPNTLKLLVAPVITTTKLSNIFLKNNFPITNPLGESADKIT